MHILLTNDDGIFAPGLAAAYKVLSRIANVTVVAPAQAQSGASHSITLSPLTFNKIDITGKFTGFSVEGSPVDCVKLGLMELTDEPVDLVVSGINFGANAGIHVHYSGTVGAAMEAAFCGVPAVALSAAYEEEIDFESAAEYCLKVIENLLPIKTPEVINVNIPMLSKGEPKGVKVVGHSINGYKESYLKNVSKEGQTEYVYMSGKHLDKKSVTDVTALLDGYITVTALHFDMTDADMNKELKNIKWEALHG